MRRLLIPLLCVLAACTAELEPDPTTSTIQPATTSSASAASTIPEATSTTAPGAVTTSAAPTTSTLALDETVLAYQSVADLDFPVQLTARPGEPQSYVITKNGLVWLYDGASVLDQPVLDISDRVLDDGEQGLLSIALHPVDSRRIFLHYSDQSGATTVSEFALPALGQGDRASERVLLQVDQPAANHNGGMLQFSPDGALLLGLGDGGGAGDRFGNGQNPDTLLGGLVSIDVDTADSAKYAMGLRNPWRFWIDGEIIYVADVGQNAYEEISVVPLQPGHNFGWPILEGLNCFSTSNCDGTGMVAPVLEVEHGDAGTCSITGGPVYRGASLPQLEGHYFYSDYCGGYLRSLLYTDGSATELRDWSEQVGVPGQVTGFGVDGAGEMYVTTSNRLLSVVAGG
ncbi:MAG TPA: PQQ-dependent sugar dehydrogenase [Acidimicrobiia bacterium]|nr:PQQ-dependent sugar dehydrogenase [Acidimicrobiia bacterium]